MSYNPPYWLDNTQSSIEVSHFGGEFPSSRVAGLESFINEIIGDLPGGFSGSYDDLTDVPTEFPPSAHTHDEYLSAVNPSTDNAIVRFDGIIGGIKNSSVTVDDDGNVEGNNFIHTGADPGQGGTGGSIVSSLLLENIANELKLTLAQTGGVDIFSNLLTLPEGFSGDYNDLTNQPDLSDLHSHSNKSVLDQFGEDGSGYPTYNGNKIDTVIAQRDVYDGLDSADNTISLAATQGTALKGLIDNIYNKTASDARYAYKAGTLGQAFSAGAMTLNGALTGTSATFSGNVNVDTTDYAELGITRGTSRLLFTNSSGVQFIRGINGTDSIDIRLDAVKQSVGVDGDGELGYALKVHGNVKTEEIIFNTYLRSSDNAAVLGTDYGGTVFLRPNNSSSSTSESTFTVAGASIKTPLGVNGLYEAGYALKVNGDQKNTGDVYANNFIHTGP